MGLNKDVFFDISKDLGRDNKTKLEEGNILEMIKEDSKLALSNILLIRDKIYGQNNKEHFVELLKIYANNIDTEEEKENFKNAINNIKEYGRSSDLLDLIDIEKEDIKEIIINRLKKEWEDDPSYLSEYLPTYKEDEKKAKYLKDVLNISDEVYDEINKYYPLIGKDMFDEKEKVETYNKRIEDIKNIENNSEYKTLIMKDTEYLRMRNRRIKDFYFPPKDIAYILTDKLSKNLKGKFEGKYIETDNYELRDISQNKPELYQKDEYRYFGAEMPLLIVLSDLTSEEQLDRIVILTDINIENQIDFADGFCIDKLNMDEETRNQIFDYGESYITLFYEKLSSEYDYFAEMISKYGNSIPQIVFVPVRSYTGVNHNYIYNMYGMNQFIFLPKMDRFYTEMFCNDIPLTDDNYYKTVMKYYENFLTK